MVLRENPFEREFVTRVLAHVENLKPDEVFPQEPFTDQDGRPRRIDFAIKRGELRLALEVDGYESSPGETRWGRDRIDDLLQRQNSLTSRGWVLLRFSNVQVMNESARCVRDIRQHLKAGPAVTAVTAVAAPPAVPAVRSATRPAPTAAPGRSRGPVVLASAAGVTAIAAAVFVATAMRGGPEAQPGPSDNASSSASVISESAQRQLDLAAGAVSPATVRDCPPAYPVKANYRSEAQTRLYFTTIDTRFYKRTTPTSCWKSPSAAEAGGYVHR